MVEADLAHQVRDLLPVELGDETHDAVRGRMVRADVEEHEVEVLALAPHAPVLGAEPHRLFHRLLHVGRHAERPHLGRAGRVLLPQRVPAPPRRHENPLQVRVPVEADAEHVPHLALVPVGGGPDVDGAGQRRRVARERHLYAHVGVAVVGEEVIDNREVARRLALAMRAGALVDGRQVVQRLVWLLDLRLEEAQDSKNVVSWHP